MAADQESRLMKDRCNWMLNPLVFNQIQQVMGAVQIDLFASHLTKQLPAFHSWRPDLEALGKDAFHQIGPRGGICQPSMLYDHSLLKPNKESGCKSGDGHPTVDSPTLVPNNPRDAGGLPQASSSSGRSSIRAGFHNESGCTNVGGMANLRESFTSQGIFPQAADLL